jgi:C_GCAxxG_C_C family probable redox protein
MYGLEGERVWSAASCFGGGVARYQSMCGALTGAAIALGIYGGRTVSDPQAIADTVRPGMRELVREFRESFGHTDCADLIPFDLNGPEGYEPFRQSGMKQQRCYQYVRFVVGTVARWNEEGAFVPGA